MQSNILKLAVSSVLLFSAVAYADINSMEEAVNKAGKQRMLTQKMLKEYSLIGMDNSYKNPKLSLVESMDLFESELKELLEFIKDKKARESLLKTQRLYDEIKKVLVSTPKRDVVTKLQEDLEQLLKACHESTLLIAKVSGSNSADIVNTSGRQRMLSQRMASLYMLKVWGVEDPKFKEKLHSAIDEFKTAHKTLVKSPLNTKKTNELLGRVGKSFRFFDMMAKRASGKFIPSLINRSANNILEDMNSATQIYAESSR